VSNSSSSLICEPYLAADVTRLMNDHRRCSPPMTSIINSIWMFVSMLTAIWPLTILERWEGYCHLRGLQSLRAQILDSMSDDCVIQMNCSPLSH